MQRIAALLLGAATLLGACAGSDDDGSSSANRAGESTSSTAVSTSVPEAVSSTTGDLETPSSEPDPDAVLDQDRTMMRDAAASGDFCEAYGAYDFLASRVDGDSPADAVALFRLGFEATAEITPLVPEELEVAWATFIFGAGLIDTEVVLTGAIPEGNAELEANLDRVGYYEAGDEVTAWYRDNCG